MADDQQQEQQQPPAEVQVNEPATEAAKLTSEPEPEAAKSEPEAAPNAEPEAQGATAKEPILQASLFVYIL